MKYQDIKAKNDAELIDLIVSERKNLRTERFKDKFSKKASIIKGAKQTIARALTEQTARRRNESTK
jgi:ribosomal protein L29